jgi:integrase
MPVQALTTDFVCALSDHAPLTANVTYFDTDIKGFMLEHRKGGGATFYFRYRDSSGKVRLHRIDKVNRISVSDARAEAHRLKKLLDSGGDPKSQSRFAAPAQSFGDFISERYLPYIQAHKRSWKTDEVLLRLHVLPVLAAQRLDRITRTSIIALHTSMREQGYAPATSNRVLLMLKFIFNCAIRWEILAVAANPCAGVSLFQDNGARERYLTQEEVGRLLDELSSTSHVQVSQVILLLLYTGARKSEILRARWEHVDLNARMLMVPVSKSGRRRHIPLSDSALEVLRELPRYEGVPWVFYNPTTGKPPVSIYNAWDTIRNRVGLPEVRLHDLRHSFASFLVNSGSSLYEVQRLLGHYDPKVTMRYAHLSPESLINAANKVGRMVHENRVGSRRERKLERRKEPRNENHPMAGSTPEQVGKRPPLIN